MARLSSVNTNKLRRETSTKHEARRDKLKEIIKNKDLDLNDRIQATIKLSEMPRSGSKVRVRNRCEITGRPRGFYRKFKMSRIALREYGSLGLIPGLVKASW